MMFAIRRLVAVVACAAIAWLGMQPQAIATVIVACFEVGGDGLEGEDLPQGTEWHNDLWLSKDQAWTPTSGTFGGGSSSGFGPSFFLTSSPPGGFGGSDGGVGGGLGGPGGPFGYGSGDGPGAPWWNPPSFGFPPGGNNQDVPYFPPGPPWAPPGPSPTYQTSNISTSEAPPVVSTPEPASLVIYMMGMAAIGGLSALRQARRRRLGS
jgi:hypothetical protein